MSRQRANGSRLSFRSREKEESARTDSRDSASMGIDTANAICRELILDDLKDRGGWCQFVRIDTAVGSAFIFAAHRNGIDHIVTSDESLQGLMALHSSLMRPADGG